MARKRQTRKTKLKRCSNQKQKGPTRGQIHDLSLTREVRGDLDRTTCSSPRHCGVLVTTRKWQLVDDVGITEHLVKRLIVVKCAIHNNSGNRVNVVDVFDRIRPQQDHIRHLSRLNRPQLGKHIQGLVRISCRSLKRLQRRESRLDHQLEFRVCGAVRTEPSPLRRVGAGEHPGTGYSQVVGQAETALRRPLDERTRHPELLLAYRLGEICVVGRNATHVLDEVHPLVHGLSRVDRVGDVAPKHDVVLLARCCYGLKHGPARAQVDLDLVDALRHEVLDLAFHCFGILQPLDRFEPRVLAVEHLARCEYARAQQLALPDSLHCVFDGVAVAAEVLDGRHAVG